MIDDQCADGYRRSADENDPCDYLAMMTSYIPPDTSFVLLMGRPWLPEIGLQTTADKTEGAQKITMFNRILGFLPFFISSISFMIPIQSISNLTQGFFNEDFPPVTACNAQKHSSDEPPKSLVIQEPREPHQSSPFCAT